MTTVSEYLQSLTEGEQPLSPKTIRGYESVLKSFAKFLGVNINDLHLHLTPENLKNYATSRKDYKPAGTKLNMTILRRFYHINDAKVANTRLEEATMARRKKVNPHTHTDIPLTLATLQDLMAVGDVRSRAILAFLISTGCRGGECAKLRFSDVKDDIVTIPDEIAKRGYGGQVYLTAEAREYLDQWLSVRDQYIRKVQKQNRALVQAGFSKPRAKKDDRLFAISYNSLLAIFTRLNKKIGTLKIAGKTEREYLNPLTGEVKIKKPGYYQLTPHSCRRYFNTHAEETMSKSLVEYLLRHQGYLSSSYYRNEKAHKEFHRGESALYINKNRENTRDDEVETLQKQVAKQQEIIDKIYQRVMSGEVVLQGIDK